MNVGFFKKVSIECIIAHFEEPEWSRLFKMSFLTSQEFNYLRFNLVATFMIHKLEIIVYLLKYIYTTVKT